VGQVRLFVVGRALRYGRAEMLPLFCTSHTAWSLPAGTGILESCREPQLRPQQTPPRQSWTSPAPHAPASPLRIGPCSRPFLLACLPQSPPRCQTTTTQEPPTQGIQVQTAHRQQQFALCLFHGCRFPYISRGRTRSQRQTEGRRSPLWRPAHRYAFLGRILAEFRVWAVAGELSCIFVFLSFPSKDNVKDNAERKSLL
jgi:hypothetical protein